MKSPPVALCFHVPGFHLPLLEEIWHPLCDIIVVHHVSEIVKSKIFDFSVIPLRETDHIWGAKVFVLAVMGCSKCFETVAHHMAIKFHQHTDKSEILRWNIPPMLGV